VKLPNDSKKDARMKDNNKKRTVSICKPNETLFTSSFIYTKIISKKRIIHGF